jgi:hypothetical protein
MVKIRIGAAEVDLADASDGWIAQQVNRRRADGGDPCVQVSITEDGIQLLLSTPQCGKMTGSGRQANAAERRIFDLWRERGLNQEDFTGGNVIAFLHQLRRLI